MVGGRRLHRMCWHQALDSSGWGIVGHCSGISRTADNLIKAIETLKNPATSIQLVLKDEIFQQANTEADQLLPHPEVLNLKRRKGMTQTTVEQSPSPSSFLSATLATPPLVACWYLEETAWRRKAGHLHVEAESPSEDARCAAACSAGEAQRVEEVAPDGVARTRAPFERATQGRVRIVLTLLAAQQSVTGCASSAQDA